MSVELTDHPLADGDEVLQGPLLGLIAGAGVHGDDQWTIAAGESIIQPMSGERGILRTDSNSRCCKLWSVAVQGETVQQAAVEMFVPGRRSDMYNTPRWNCFGRNVPTGERTLDIEDAIVVLLEPVESGNGLWGYEIISEAIVKTPAFRSRHHCYGGGRMMPSNLPNDRENKNVVAQIIYATNKYS